MNFWSSTCGFVKPCTEFATAASPYGPFTKQPPVHLHGGTPSSQMGFFVDEDGKTTYVKYNTVGPFQVRSARPWGPATLRSLIALAL